MKCIPPDSERTRLVIAEKLKKQRPKLRLSPGQMLTIVRPEEPNT